MVVGGCASYATGLHLMRTGAVAVSWGLARGRLHHPGGAWHRRAPTTAIADVAAARSQHMLETGEYVKVIADGGMRNGGDVSKAIACGADMMIGSPLARAYEAPGHGFHWGMATFHASLPRARVETAQNGSLTQILLGPAHARRHLQPRRQPANVDGHLATRTSAFHKAEVMVAPALQSEGNSTARAVDRNGRHPRPSKRASANGVVGAEPALVE